MSAIFLSCFFFDFSLSRVVLLFPFDSFSHHCRRRLFCRFLVVLVVLVVLFLFLFLFSLSTPPHPPARQSMYGTVRDERPIHDRDYIDGQIVDLMDFLISNAFNNPISRRDLLHPTSKKFAEIISFMFRKVDPSFRFSKNHVNDVHNMFKGLAYPVQISKTSLTAAGSPQSWPSLLASLTWLSDLISFDLRAQELKSESQSDDVNVMFFDYLVSAYDSFMANDDETYNRLDEELADTFRERDETIIQDTEEIKNKNEQLRQELEELLAAASSLPSLQEKHQEYQDGLMKFDEQLMKMSKGKEAHQARMMTNEEKLKVKREKLSMAEGRRNVLTEQLRSQDLSAHDVERISQDRSRLRSEMDTAEEVKEALHSNMWELEQTGNKLVVALDQQIRTYIELGKNERKEKEKKKKKKFFFSFLECRCLFIFDF